MLLFALSIKVRHNLEYRKKLLTKLWEFSIKKEESEEMRIMSWLDGHFGEELFNYQYLPATPLTSNLIETFNGHLEDRLASIKGFESYQHAQLWLNAYILKRRFTKFTDCGRKFHRLNGQRPIDQTRNLNIDIPDVF
jgi:hypothetical protein